MTPDIVEKGYAAEDMDEETEKSCEEMEENEEEEELSRVVDLELDIKMTQEQVDERVEVVENLEKELNMMYNMLKIFLEMEKTVEEPDAEEIGHREELERNLVFHGVEKDPVELEVGDDVEVKKHVLEHIINLAMKKQMGMERRFNLVEAFR